MLRSLAVLAIAVGHLAAAAEPLPSADAPAEAMQGVLLLNEGGVLTGQISRSADRYLVSSEGSQINVPVANVALVCCTMVEAYEHRRNALPNQTADAHLELAGWCLRNNLSPQAAEELLIVRGLDPQHPRLELFERRLAVAGAPKPEPASNGAEPKPPEPPAVDSEPARQSETATVPADVLERFTRRIQPLLVNNCTTSGCHQIGGSQAFQLDRALVHGMANRRATMRNLQATLTLVDRSRPQTSPLLTIPRQDHGGTRKPILGPRQSQQFLQLVEWVAMVAQSSSNSQAHPADEMPTEETEAFTKSDINWREPILRLDRNNRGIGAATAPAAPRELSEATAMPPADDDYGVMLASAELLEKTPPRVQFGAQIHAWQPRDEFDPEIFNRRYRNKADESR